jgi:hypothetical protein
MPNSYRTIGNDGHRTGVAITASPTNISAPASVINALYQMSNKYPVMVDLAVTPNTSGSSLPDPEITPSAVASVSMTGESIRVVNPANGTIRLLVSDRLIGQSLQVELTDISGRMLMERTIVASSTTTTVENTLAPGTYIIRVNSSQGIYLKKILLIE